MSLENIKNITNFEDWDLTLVAYKIRVKQKVLLFIDTGINSSSDRTSIKLQQKEKYENLIIGHLNIILFEMEAEIIQDFNIFLISEPKLDSIFPKAKFQVTGFKICTKTDLAEGYLYK